MIVVALRLLLRLWLVGVELDCIADLRAIGTACLSLGLSICKQTLAHIAIANRITADPHGDGGYLKPRVSELGGGAKQGSVFV